MQESVDVDVPIRVAYDQWTQFESFPQFMGGVERITQLDDTHTHWVTKIGGVEREFDAEITEQHPEERIAWTSTTGEAKHAGVVTFHRLDENKTRVMIQIDWEPEGLVEKVGAAVGVDDHQVKADAKRFKEFIESRGTETGAWRGDVERPTLTPARSTKAGAVSPAPFPAGDGRRRRAGGLRYSASRSWATMPAIWSSAAWSSLLTMTSVPCLAPSVMIISGGSRVDRVAAGRRQGDGDAGLADGLGDECRRPGVQPDPGADGDGLTGHRPLPRCWGRVGLSLPVRRGARRGRRGGVCACSRSTASSGASSASLWPKLLAIVTATAADDRADHDRQQPQQEVADREEHEHPAVRGPRLDAAGRDDRAGGRAAEHHRRDDPQRVGRGERDRALGDERQAEQPRGLAVPAPRG